MLYYTRRQEKPETIKKVVVMEKGEIIGRLEKYSRECQTVAMNARGGFRDWCMMYVAELETNIAGIRAGDMADEQIAQLAEEHLRYSVGGVA